MFNAISQEWDVIRMNDGNPYTKMLQPWCVCVWGGCSRNYIHVERRVYVHTFGWHIFSKRPHQMSEVIQRSSCLQNDIWLPNSVGSTNNKRECITVVKQVTQESAEVNQKSKYLEIPHGYQIC